MTTPGMVIGLAIELGAGHQGVGMSWDGCADCRRPASEPGAGTRCRGACAAQSSMNGLHDDGMAGGAAGHVNQLEPVELVTAFPGRRPRRRNCCSTRGVRRGSVVLRGRLARAGMIFSNFLKWWPSEAISIRRRAR